MGPSFFDKEAMGQYILRFQENRLEEDAQHRQKEEEIGSWFVGSLAQGPYLKAMSDERRRYFSSILRIRRDALFEVIRQRKSRLRDKHLPEIRESLEGGTNALRDSLIEEQQTLAKGHGLPVCGENVLRQAYDTVRARVIGYGLELSFIETKNQQRAEAKATCRRWADRIVAGFVGAILRDLVPFLGHQLWRLSELLRELGSK